MPLVPKGLTAKDKQRALMEKRKPRGESPTDIVNDKVAEQAVPQKPSPPAEIAGRAEQIRKLNETVTDLKKQLVKAEASSKEAEKLKTRAEKAEAAIDAIDSEQWKTERAKRKQALFLNLLTGAAAAGQLLIQNSEAAKDRLANIIANYIGVAELAEDMAAKRGL